MTLAIIIYNIRQVLKGHNYSFCRLMWVHNFFHVPAFLNRGLPRGNVHKRDSGPMRDAILTQSHNP